MLKLGREISGILVDFLSQDSDTAKPSIRVAKAVNKANLGSRLLMLTCMKPKLLRLQKSTNESTWGHAGPGITSTSPEEQRRSRMKVRLMAINTGRLLRWGQRIKGEDFWAWWIDSGHNVQMGMVWCRYSGGKPRH